MSFGGRVAVVGATGAVGQVLLGCLESREFPVTELIPIASPRSEGKRVGFKGQELRCQILKPGIFKGVDIAFFDASDAISKEWVPRAVDEGAWVVDNSASFRLDPDVPLIVPEVNGMKLGSPRSRVLTGPNCSTVELVVALQPIAEGWGLRRVVVSSYQSVSGAGSAAIEELKAQTKDALSGERITPKIFSHAIAFNCIPQIGRFEDSGNTSEEAKIIAETKKILGLPELKISATAVRVPTISCHGESVNVECVFMFEMEEIRKAFGSSPGVVLIDDPGNGKYPMGIDCAGKDPVFVGRLRRDPSLENALNFWVVSDNVRKGAALNAIQIAELLLENVR